MNSHKHPGALKLGPGNLIIHQYNLPVVKSLIYLKMKDLGDEQRVCITFNQIVNLKQIIDEAFITLKLRKPFYAYGSTIPINKLELFALSGLQNTQSQIDFLVSPRIKLIDNMLHTIE